MLEMNGVPGVCIHKINIHDKAFPTGPFDVILSLLSWGFHYPVDLYLPKVLETLAPNGILRAGRAPQHGGSGGAGRSFRRGDNRDAMRKA